MLVRLVLDRILLGRILLALLLLTGGEQLKIRFAKICPLVLSGLDAASFCQIGVPLKWGGG